MAWLVLRLVGSSLGSLATTVAGPVAGGAKVSSSRALSATWPVPTGVATTWVTSAPSASVRKAGVSSAAVTTGRDHMRAGMLPR
jgi:hypothetical protein